MAKATSNVEIPIEFLRNGKPNKSAIMREGLNVLGVETKGVELKKWVEEKYGLQLLNSDMVALSTMRKKLKEGGDTPKPYSSNGHAKAAKATPVATSSNAEAVSTIKAVKIAVDACGSKEALIDYVNEMSW